MGIETKAMVDERGTVDDEGINYVTSQGLFVFSITTRLGPSRGEPLLHALSALYVSHPTCKTLTGQRSDLGPPRWQTTNDKTQPVNNFDRRRHDDLSVHCCQLSKVSTSGVVAGCEYLQIQEQ